MSCAKAVWLKAYVTSSPSRKRGNSASSTPKRYHPENDPLSNPIDPHLVGIVEKASSLFERLGPEFVLSSEVDAVKADRLLDQWCLVATAGDKKLFERRLA